MVDKIIGVIKQHGLVFLAVTIIVTPIVWQGSASYFHERIETLKAQIELCKEQKRALEEKLRQPSSAPEQTPQVENEGRVSPLPSQSDTTPATSRLPHIVNPNMPTKDEVRELARFYNLFNRWKVNPRLRFKEGDISYWAEQGFTEKELMLEFESRQTVLRRAEKSGEKIPSQGDLSHKAEQLQTLSQ